MRQQFVHPHQKPYLIRSSMRNLPLSLASRKALTSPRLRGEVAALLRGG
jgi:hypothetical protein